MGLVWSVHRYCLVKSTDNYAQLWRYVLENYKIFQYATCNPPIETKPASFGDLHADTIAAEITSIHNCEAFAGHAYDAYRNFTMMLVNADNYDPYMPPLRNPQAMWQELAEMPGFANAVELALMPTFANPCNQHGALKGYHNDESPRLRAELSQTAVEEIARQARKIYAKCQHAESMADSQPV